MARAGVGCRGAVSDQVLAGRRGWARLGSPVDGGGRVRNPRRPSSRGSRGPAPAQPNPNHPAPIMLPRLDALDGRQGPKTTWRPAPTGKIGPPPGGLGFRQRTRTQLRFQAIRRPHPTIVTTQRLSLRLRQLRMASLHLQIRRHRGRSCPGARPEANPPPSAGMNPKLSHYYVPVFSSTRFLSTHTFVLGPWPWPRGLFTLSARLVVARAGVGCRGAVSDQVLAGRRGWARLGSPVDGGGRVRNPRRPSSRGSRGPAPAQPNPNHPAPIMLPRLDALDADAIE